MAHGLRSVICVECEGPTSKSQLRCLGSRKFTICTKAAVFVLKHERKDGPMITPEWLASLTSLDVPKVFVYGAGLKKLRKITRLWRNCKTPFTPALN